MNQMSVSPSIGFEEHQIQYQDPYSDPRYVLPAQNPNQYEDAYLGSSCVIDGFEDFSTYYSSFPDPELNNISAPHLFQSSTFPAQPTFQLSASTPITPHVPPRPFSRCSDDSQDMVGALSPEPCASERSARSNRAQSMPEPSASARFSRFRQHLTPEAQEEPSPVTTPHYIQAATPLMQDLRTPDLTHSSPPSRFYTPIAPNPLGLLQMHARKHSYSDDETDWLTSKRHKSTPSSPSIEMTEEDTLLLQLKDAEALSWKDIQGRFSEELGKTYQVPALQMRLKRLRERMRVWTEGDIHALRLAHEFWLNQKFDIISSKMLEFGATEKWSNKQCARKWQEICWTPECQPMLRTSTYSSAFTESPIDFKPGPLGLYIAPITTN